MRRRARSRGERLQKVLAQLGLASRREAEAWIRAGRLTVNGSSGNAWVARAPDDQVRLDGRVGAPPRGAAMRVFMCHRSPGRRRSGSREERGMRRMASRLPSRAGRRFIAVSPMPRIDGGLELLTSDGELAREAAARGASPGERVQRARARRAERQRNARACSAACLTAARRSPWRAASRAGGAGANRWYSAHRARRQRQGCAAALRTSGRARQPRAAHALWSLDAARAISPADNFASSRASRATRSSPRALAVEALPGDAAARRPEERNIGSGERSGLRQRLEFLGRDRPGGACACAPGRD